MTKPTKTLGELLDEDWGRKKLIDHDLAQRIEAWLDLHNITDATPLMVEAVGVVLDESRHYGVEFCPSDDSPNNASYDDITGRTVVLLADCDQEPTDKPGEGK